MQKFYHFYITDSIKMEQVTCQMYLPIFCIFIHIIKMALCPRIYNKHNGDVAGYKNLTTIRMVVVKESVVSREDISIIRTLR